MQRVVGIALGYEDLNDHDDLRHDPVLAVLAGKLEAQRSDCAPLAGKSTLNRLELSRAEPTLRYLSARSATTLRRSRRCSSMSSSTNAHNKASRSSSTSMPRTTRCMDSKKASSSTATMIATATCRSTSSAAGTCWPPSCAARTSMAQPAQWKRPPASWRRSAAAGQKHAFCCAAIPASPANH